MLREVDRAESAFVDSPSELTEKTWHEALHIAKHLVLTKVENKRLFLQQKYFEEGETTGHVLAMMVRLQKGLSHIEAINNSSGTLVF